MSMKLSYREKVIFIAVMVILVLVAGYFLLIRTKFDSRDDAKRKLEETQAKWTEVENKIKTYPEIVKNMKLSLDQIEEQQQIFLEELHPYLNERYIREALAEVNVELTEVSTEYAYADYLEKYIVENKNILSYENKINADLFNELPQEVYDHYNKVQREVSPASIIGITDMTIKFESDITLNDVYAVMDRIAQDEKTIILNTVSNNLDEGAAEPTQEITVEMSLYSIFPLNIEKLREEPETVEEAVEAAKKAAAGIVEETAEPEAAE